MATAATSLIRDLRRFMGDWPELDTLAASLTSSATTITIGTNPADDVLSPNWLIQVDQEAMRVRTSASNAATATVFRGANGTTAASHASGATVLIRPRWLDAEYLAAINAAIDASFPSLYQPVIDESLTATATTYEYTVPNLNSVPIPYIRQVEVSDTGDTVFREKRDWDVIRGSTPKIRFRRSEVGTIRVLGFGPFVRLAIGDSLSALFPPNAEPYLLEYAAQHLLSSGEAQRVRVDIGATDSREQANRTGSSMSAGNSLYQRAQLKLAMAAMAPIPPHVRATF